MAFTKRPKSGRTTDPNTAKNHHDLVNNEEMSTKLFILLVNFLHFKRGRGRVGCQQEVSVLLMEHMCALKYDLTYILIHIHVYVSISCCHKFLHKYL